MLSTSAIALGGTLGAATGLLVLCGLICMCSCLHKKMSTDSETPVTMASVLQQDQPMSIYNCTEPVRLQARVHYPYAYCPKQTSPEVINYKDYAVKIPEKEMKESDGLLADRKKGTTPGDGVTGTTTNENYPAEDVLEKKNVFYPVPKLRYSLGYEGLAEELCVSFLEAVGPTLPGGEDLESLCYVLGTLNTHSGQTEAQTALVKRLQHTVWEEALIFPLKDKERAQGTLTLSLRNCDCFSRHQVAGKITLSLANVGIPFGTARWVELKAPEKVSPTIQEVLLSMSYLPAANRLIVVIIKARNIHSDQHNDLLCKDMSMKVNLKHRSQRLKKKQSKRVKHKINPVWNEIIMFEIPPELLEEITVELEMVSQEPKRTSNRVSGAVRVLGRCCLGLDKTGTGKSHWQDMMNNPRRQIAMWHSLRP
ncbi:synaptotagmin-13 isoform 1-T1 [Pelodytes ibericus]